MDKQDVSRFQLLQQEEEPRFAVFDRFFYEGPDLRGEPLALRFAAIERALDPSKVLLPSRSLATNGLEAFHVAKRQGHEGLVAKDLSFPYVDGRSSKWLEVKAHQEDEFVIAGYTKPAGSGKDFGTLLLGAYESSSGSAPPQALSWLESIPICILRRLHLKIPISRRLPLP